MNNQKFGSFIKELRREKGVTQKQLSEALGITDGAVSKWERGLSFPDITLLGSLADYFGVNVGELLEGERGSEAPSEDIAEAVKQAAFEAELAAARRMINTVKKLLRVLLPILLAVCAVLQMVYLLIFMPRGYEYIFDSLSYIINAVAILAVGGIAALMINKRKLSTAIFVVCGILMVLNIVFINANSPNRRSVVTYSHSLKNAVVVKIDAESGGATYYRSPKFLLLSRPKERLAADVEGNMKTQWLENDICALTWIDSSGKLNTFIATYGSRGDTVSYDYVAPALSGDWKTSSGKDIRLLAEQKGITVITEGESEFFEYSDCRQYGTIALVLSNDGIPKYTVALNRDCELDDKTGLIKKGGTITLCAVDSEKTPAYTLYCTTPKDEDLSNYSTINIDKNGFAIKNGTLYVSYDGQNAVALPYPSDQIIISDGLYIISPEKTVFVKISDSRQSLLISDNSGADWYETPLEKEYSAQSLQFLESNIGYMLEICDVAMGTARGRLSKTADGGKTWEPIFHGIESANGPVFNTAGEFIFTEESIGFLNMPSRGGEDCILYRSLDGGKTFIPLELPDSRYDYFTLPEITDNGLTFTVNGGNDAVLEPHEKQYISTDNGRSWQEKENQYE